MTWVPTPREGASISHSRADAGEQHGWLDVPPGVMSALIEQLRAQARAIAQRAVAEMYQNPSWQERLGGQGREQADQDDQLHVSYLVQALAASDPSVLANYAHGLQVRLVSRGMCSRHIDENFERLERAIGALVPDSGPARQLLHEARRALIYVGGPPRELQLLADALAEAVLDALTGRQPGWFSAASYVSLASFESIVLAERARWKSDVLDHLSYLADALHAERPSVFLTHVAWAEEFFARRHGPPLRLLETLYALAECLPPGPGGALGAPKRASLRPAPSRPPLSEPPPLPVPVLMTPELAASARALVASALEQLAPSAREPAPRTPAERRG